MISRFKAAALAVMVLIAANACARRRAPTAGFWYEDGALAAAAHLAGTTLEPLTPEEIATIASLSRFEVEHAFSELRITVSDDPNAFWRVKAVASLPVRKGQPLPHSGESLPLGMLGGIGTVGLDLVMLEAIHYAPTGASRPVLIEGVGRGAGRVAVHEFFHQMLDVASGHNDTDEDSYEYGNPDRASQYFGDLHWTTAWPLLREKFGR